VPRISVNVRPTSPLSLGTVSDSFLGVSDLLSVFREGNRPEFRFLGLYFPWIFVVSLAGFLTAWLLTTILERTGLSRHIWHLPLFFVALVVLLTSIFGFILFP
jgi:hypothetical protein